MARMFPRIITARERPRFQGTHQERLNQYCRFCIDQDDDALVLRRWTGSLGIGSFLIAWLSGWTVASVDQARDLM